MMMLAQQVRLKELLGTGSVDDAVQVSTFSKTQTFVQITGQIFVDSELAASSVACMRQYRA